MEVFTIAEFQEQFDQLIERVETGETIGILDEEGNAYAMMPTDDEFYRIHTEQNNEAQ